MYLKSCGKTSQLYLLIIVMYFCTKMITPRAVVHCTYVHSIAVGYRIRFEFVC